eukprot:scaffold131341_cov31-Tisochrysis_lutea.AAC.12
MALRAVTGTSHAAVCALRGSRRHGFGAALGWQIRRRNASGRLQRCAAVHALLPPPAACRGLSRPHTTHGAHRASARLQVR